MASSDDSAAQLVQKVADSIGKLFTEKDKTVGNLKGVARDLNQMQSNIDGTNTVSSFGSIVGSGLFFFGLLAAPATGGMSAYASFGLMLSASAAGVKIFADGYKWLKENEYMKLAKTNIENYESVHKTFSKVIENIHDEDLVNEMMKELEYLQIHRKVKETVFLVLCNIKIGIQIREKKGKFGMNYGIIAARAALGAAQSAVLLTAGAKFLPIGGLGLSVLAVPLDIHTFITSVGNLGKEEPSKTAAAINDVAKKLDDQSIVEITDNSETMEVLKGCYDDRVLSDGEYSRLVKQICENNKEMADAILT